MIPTIPVHVTLLAASKGRSVEQIQTLNDQGVRVFGESYVQEAEEKITALADRDIQWHFIGHIQSNKAKRVAELFTYVDSVDSAKVARKLDLAYGELGRIGIVLVQVNISQEEQKHGILPGRVGRVLAEIVTTCKHVHVAGLMCIGSKGNAESEYNLMKQLFDAYQEEYKLSVLSMGMSADYEIAIKYGATQIRLGSLLFD